MSFSRSKLIGSNRFYSGGPQYDIKYQQSSIPSPARLKINRTEIIELIIYYLNFMDVYSSGRKEINGSGKGCGITCVFFCVLSWRRIMIALCIQGFPSKETAVNIVRFTMYVTIYK
jgi:hypothetical protein